jgi:sirohydrochlorin ferrochelatase
MSASPASSPAVLLVAHGSRRAAANDDLLQLAGALAERRIHEIVEVSYLELAEPTIPTGARRCVERGARTVLMLPWFLSAGNHVVADLERYRLDLSTEFPNVRFELCPPLGIHPLMVDVVLERLGQRLNSSAAGDD